MSTRAHTHTKAYTQTHTRSRTRARVIRVRENACTHTHTISHSRACMCAWVGGLYEDVATHYRHTCTHVHTHTRKLSHTNTTTHVQRRQGYLKMWQCCTSLAKRYSSRTSSKRHLQLSPPLCSTTPGPSSSTRVTTLPTKSKIPQKC